MASKVKSNSLLSEFAQEEPTKEAYTILTPYLQTGRESELRSLIMQSSESTELVDLRVLRLLIAAFHLSPSFAADLVTDSAIEKVLKDSIEVYLELDDGTERQEFIVALALLNEIASMPKTRRILSSLLPLIVSLFRMSATPYQILPALILTKIKFGWQNNAVEDPAINSIVEEINFLHILETVKDCYVHRPLASKFVKISMETLAYLTLDLDVRKMIMKDSMKDFRAALFAVITRESTDIHNLGVHEVRYGFANTLSNMVSYQRETDETAKIERFSELVQAANRTKQSAGREPPSVTHIRVASLLNSNPEVLSCLSIMCRSTMSTQMRALLGSIFLNLTENQNTKIRGLLIQGGAARSILTLVSKMDFSINGRIEEADLCTIQSLARLFISFHPCQIVKVDELPSVIFVLSALLLDKRSSSLQSFEALMSLTNIASLSSAEAGDLLKDRIAATIDKSGASLLKSVHGFMMDDYFLISRAATELTCNLVSCQAGFDYWTGGLDSLQSLLSSEASIDQGETSMDVEGASSSLRSISNRIDLLLALSTISDVPTRSAASGTLATIIHSDVARYCILHRVRNGKGGLSVIATLLADEEASIRWRGLEITRVLSMYTDLKHSVLTSALEEMINIQEEDSLKEISLEVYNVITKR